MNEPTQPETVILNATDTFNVLGKADSASEAIKKADYEITYLEIKRGYEDFEVQITLKSRIKF